MWWCFYPAVMSIPVPLAELPATLGRFRFAYLLTVDDAQRAHLVAITPTLADGRLRVTGAGWATFANAAARADITVLWPPTERGGHSLIVDGAATRVGDELVVDPTHAVLHRPAPGESPPVGSPLTG